MACLGLPHITYRAGYHPGRLPPALHRHTVSDPPVLPPRARLVREHPALLAPVPLCVQAVLPLPCHPRFSHHHPHSRVDRLSEWTPKKRGVGLGIRQRPQTRGGEPRQVPA